MHVGAASLVLSLVGGAIAGGCSGTPNITGAARTRCQWAGGIASGVFAAASIPFFVLGARQRTALLLYTSRVTFVAGLHHASFDRTAAAF